MQSKTRQVRFFVLLGFFFIFIFFITICFFFFTIYMGLVASVCVYKKCVCVCKKIRECVTGRPRVIFFKKLFFHTCVFYNISNSSKFYFYKFLFNSSNFLNVYNAMCTQAQYCTYIHFNLRTEKS